MTNEELTAFPTRSGHFLLESGMHADEWSDLAGLFVDSRAIEPSVAMLADRLRGLDVQAVCGPLVGGAFLAQLLAQALGVDFFYAESRASDASKGLFTATYALPASQARRAAGRRVAIVDDAVSAGSSVRACTSALEACGATVVAVGSLVAYGDATLTHFAARAIPVIALGQRAFRMWAPAECPFCAAGVALTDAR